MRAWPHAPLKNSHALSKTHALERLFGEHLCSYSHYTLPFTKFCNKVFDFMHSEVQLLQANKPEAVTVCNKHAGLSTLRCRVLKRVGFK